MKTWITRYSFFFAGLLLFGFANAMAVKVKYLGLHPWEVLHVSLFQKFGFSIGTWSVLVGLALISVAWFVNRKYINIGTFLNTLLIGPFMDFFLWLDIIPEATNAWQDYAQLFTAILISSVAGGLYVAGGVGAGPRDGFMLSLSERTRLSVSQARIAVECVVLLIGFSLGGPIGVITFLYTFIQSPIFQVTLRWFQKLLIYLTDETAKQVQVKG